MQLGKSRRWETGPCVSVRTELVMWKDVMREM